jgi:phosphoglycerol transferase MdoB-like AlkP superfamily enzyme
MQKSATAVYLQTLASIAMLMLLATLIFTLARLAAWAAYIPSEEHLVNAELWDALWIGFRFDLAFAARGMVLALLASLVALPFSPWLASPAWLITRCLGRLVLLLAVLFSVINFVYLDFFSRPIDSFAFSGMQYGTATAWQTVSSISNFPVVLGTAIFAAVLSLHLYGTWERKITAAVDANLGKVKITPALIFIPLLVIAMIGRGTVTTFPLSYRHLAVSSDSSLNNIVPNGLVALYYGYKDFKKSRHMLPADDAEGRLLFETFYGQAAKPGALFPQFFSTTATSDFLESNPPNVVFNLVESMGQALLLEQFSEGVDLRGKMATHLDEDIYFGRFLPGQNDTQKSLTSLMLNTEYGDISRSGYKDIELQTSAAKVFRDAGYRTVFVYGGFEGLMNRGSYFRAQGFEEFIGARKLKSLFPEMEESVWGGDDKYVFEQVWNILTQQSDDPRPLFIMTLTITNHPPYKWPAHHQKSPLELNSALADRLQNLSPDSLETYLYTNNLLGQLISRTKRSKLKSNTIIAATGDHSIRGMRFDRSEQLHRLSVPFYLYIPDNYKPIKQPDTEQVASHKDVMPTLFNLALSNARYVNLGRNLLVDSAANRAHDFAYNANYLVLNNAAYSLSAVQTLTGDTAQGIKLSNDFHLTRESAKLDVGGVRQAQIYPAILDWLTRYQLLAPAGDPLTGARN